jgi:glucose-1-phosphate thymidylyltransferase
MSKLEVIIPAAGAGKRLRPHSHSVPKPLIHVAGKPILGHILDEVEKLNPSRVIPVIGHKASLMQEYISTRMSGLYEPVYQPEPSGIGHAVWLAGKKLRGGPLLVVLGDTIFRTDLKAVIKKKRSAIAVKPVDDPSRFGVVEVRNGRITKVTEKPKRPRSNLAIVGIYYMEDSRTLLEELDRLISSGKRTKGEFQFTDALSGMILRGHRLGTFRVKGWYDCGTVPATLDANADLLSLFGGNNRRIDGSTVLKPSHVDRTAEVVGSVIGPHTSIAAGAVVSGSIIRNSIIEENALVSNAILERSIVGRSAAIRGNARRVNVSELSELSDV